MRLPGIIRRWRYVGSRQWCPCCNRTARAFMPFGAKGRVRPNVKCPWCGSLERHRLFWLYLRERTDLFRRPATRLLHVAPEPFLTRLLRATPGIQYISADLMAPGVTVRMDLTRLPFPDGAFDVIFCSHVLEHVPDDRAAMRELRRILAPGGWAILQVPLDPARGQTDEDPSITDPAERLRRFGQEDHVRWYGRDYADRLREAGFQVRVDDFARTLDKDVTRRAVIETTEDIHFCTPGPGVAAGV